MLKYEPVSQLSNGIQSLKIKSTLSVCHLLLKRQILPTQSYFYRFEEVKGPEFFYQRSMPFLRDAPQQSQHKTDSNNCIRQQINITFASKKIHTKFRSIVQK